MGHRDWRIAMDVKVKEIAAQIGPGLNVQGYAVICDSQIRDWFRSKEEAQRVAELFKDDASNPEDY
tara:strand:- start:4784 stop:4981 length:198 start_codon:yes stop_codon:yes gene_type:complete